MRRLIATALAALALALAGCGGDDNGGSDQPTTPELTPPKTAGQTVALIETDFKLDPANPTIDEPGDVVFRVSNRGDVEHSLEVEGPNGETELDQALAPGDSGRLEVKLDKAGRYEWYCPIGNHRQLGMEGEVTVGGGSTRPEDKSQSEDSGGGTVVPQDQSQSGTGGGGGTVPQDEGGSPSTGGSGGTGGGGGGSGGGGGGTQPQGGSGSPSTGGSGY